MLIVGPCGTGKSHIAQALGHSAIRAGFDVLFTTVSKMLGQLNAVRATNAYDRPFAKLSAVDLLIIDDFGLKPLQGSQDEDLHDVIAERYERKSTRPPSTGCGTEPIRSCWRGRVTGPQRWLQRAQKRLLKKVKNSRKTQPERR